MQSSVYLSATKRIEKMPVLATLLILNTTMISPLSRQNTWPCLISFLSLGKPPEVFKKIKHHQNMPLSVLLSLYVPPLPHPKILCLYAQIGGEGEAYMFSDGKVVENIFRLNIPSDPRMVDIHLFVCITLVIKHNSAKIALFLCLSSPPHTLTFLIHFQFHSQP